jgi:hypothetical protein
MRIEIEDKEKEVAVLPKSKNCSDRENIEFDLTGITARNNNVLITRELIR